MTSFLWGAQIACVVYTPELITRNKPHTKKKKKIKINKPKMQRAFACKILVFAYKTPIVCVIVFSFICVRHGALHVFCLLYIVSIASMF